MSIPAITQTISTPPAPPVAGSGTFDADADACVTYFSTFATEVNELVAQENAVASRISSVALSVDAVQEAATQALDAAQQIDADKAASAASAASAATSANTASTKSSEASASATTASAAATIATDKSAEASASATLAASAQASTESARDEALSARNAALTASDIAASHAAEASDAATAAGQAKTASESARDAAIGAKDLAVSSQESAALAATTATTQATEAATSAASAAQSAASAAEIALGNIPMATTDTAGRIELATAAEVQAGTDASRAVTPAAAAASFATSGHNHDSAYATASHDHASTYAPIAKGVTNGDSHNHDGGDGAQIAYSSLSGTPTIPSASSTAPAALGTAAAGSGTTFARADHVHAMPTAANVGALASGADINLSDYKVQRPYLQDWAEVVNARGSISGAQTIDLELGNVVTATITAATQFTFSNPPASGRAGGFVLVLTNGGAGVVTWPTSCKGLPPALTASGTDILAFLVTDGGTTYNCSYKLDVK